MSQNTVEQVIGRLVTDERFRRDFAADPARAIQEIVDCGRQLNYCERRALLRIDPLGFERFAETLDPRLLKVDLSGGIS